MPTRTFTNLDWLKTALVVETDECQLWPFATDKDGRGCITVNRKKRFVHHVALELVGREAPIPPLETRHLCGTSGCFNPRHLLNGTSKENSADCVRHGTWRHGETHHCAKISTAQVEEIRASRETNKALAERFQINPSQVSRIRNGKRRVDG